MTNHGVGMDNFWNHMKRGEGEKGSGGEGE